jgi:hypothetical protein
LIEELKNVNPAYSKAKNGKIYANVKLWINDEPDRFGNNASLKLSDNENVKGIYIGNLKESVKRIVEPTDFDPKDLIDSFCVFE